MTALETACLMDLALLAGDRELAEEAYSIYLVGSSTWRGHLDRIWRIWPILEWMEIDLISGPGGWVRVQR